MVTVLNVLARFTRLALFLNCLRVAVMATDSQNELTNEIVTLFLMFIAFLFFTNRREKLVNDISKFTFLAKKMGYSAAGDYNKLYGAFVSFFTSSGLCILFLAAVLVLSR